MRYQQTNYSCGAAAIANALRCFGKKVPERTLLKLSGTTKQNGVDGPGIMQALTTLQYPIQEINSPTPPANLDHILQAGSPIILSVDNNKHWVTVVGKINDRYILVDSTRTKANKNENGVHIVSRRELLRRWRCKDETNKYYGIAISRRA